jgi:integrase/recombinase XerD
MRKPKENLVEIPAGLSRPLEEYLSDCARRGYSAASVYCYRKALSHFLEWLCENYNGLCKVSEISREMIAGYQMFLYSRSSRFGRRLSPESQYHLLGVVLWFFRWMLAQEKIVINPAATINLPKRAQRIPRNYLSLREMQKLLKAPDLSTHEGLRSRAILEVLYSTGIRNSELRAIKTDDVNLKEGLLTVRQGKGGKDRMAPLGKAAVYFLAQYLEKTRPKLIGEKKHSYVFINRYGSPFSSQTVNKIVQKAARAAGIKRTITPHCIRHTCATLMLRGHADIRHIQELLGHACLSSTQIYTRVEIGDLKKVHQRCHPREKEPLDSK